LIARLHSRLCFDPLSTDGIVTVFG
jgi:hypothetical protein